MEEKKQLLISLAILAGISYWFFFIATNVNPNLGNIYNGLTIGAAVFIIADYLFGKQSIKLINKNVSWGSALMWGMGGYIALLVSTQLASSLSRIVPLTELLGLLGASAPVFSQSPIINFLTFGDVIAYIETFALFIAALDLFATVFNVELNKKSLTNPKLWGIIFTIALGFLLLHVTAKGVEDETTLILVFLMAVISMVITVLTLDARPALILHMLANTIAATSIFVIAKTSLVLFPKLILILHLIT